MEQINLLINNANNYLKKIDGYQIEMTKTKPNISSFDWDSVIKSFFNWCRKSDEYISSYDIFFSTILEIMTKDRIVNKSSMQDFAIFAKKYSSPEDAKRLCLFILKKLQEIKSQQETVVKKNNNSNVLEKIIFHIKKEKQEVKIIKCIINPDASTKVLRKSKHQKTLYEICKNRKTTFRNKEERNAVYKNMFVDDRGTLRKYGYKNLIELFIKQDERIDSYIIKITDPNTFKEIEV